MAPPARRPVPALARATAAYVLGWTAHVTFIFYLAPVALRAAGLRDHDAWVFSGTAVASVLAALPAGRLADRWSRRRVLGLGVALLALAYAPLLAPPSFGLVLLATALTGTGLSLTLVSFNAYVADLAAQGGMPAAYGRATALGVLAGAIGPFLAAGVFGLAPGEAAGVRANAALFGLLGAAGVLLTLGLPSARAVAPPAPAPNPGTSGARSALGPAALGYLVVGVGSGMASPYFAVYFLGVLDAGDATWGVLLGFSTLASAVGSILVGRWAARWGPERLLVAPQAVLALASLPFLAPLGLAMLGVAYVARSFFVFTLSPTLNAALMARVEQAGRGRAQAWLNVAWNVGWATGAAVGGLALARLGGATFLVGGLLNLAGVAAGAWLLARR